VSQTSCAYTGSRSSNADARLRSLGASRSLDPPHQPTSVSLLGDGCAAARLCGSLPVFFSQGSPGQLILGLIVCFLTCNSAGVEPRLLCTCGRLIGGLHPCGATDGMYTHFAPYEGSSDGSLAQLAQLTIFFSLVASLVTNAYPEE
jgi:hypothetical protein